MPTSRLEVDVRRLLSKCEEMAKQDDLAQNWRLPKFIETANKMIQNLKNTTMKPLDEQMQKYEKQIEFLEKLLETEKVENILSKSIAVQMIPPPSVLNETAAKEIYQKSLAICENDVRKELFQDSSELRNRFAYLEPSGSQELDSILKYHNEKHEQISSDMLSMTRNIKEQSEMAGRIIRDDTKTLEKSSKIMDNNYYSLQKHSNRLQDFISRSSWNCWVWILLIIMIVIFLNVIFFMKITKKKY